MRRALIAVALTISGCASNPHGKAAGAPPTQRAREQIITTDEAITEAELKTRAENAMVGQRWQEAARDFAVLFAAHPEGPNASSYLFHLAMCHEALEDREKARDEYRQVAERFQSSSQAKAALVRVATLHAYLEEWKPLGEIANTILQRRDADDVDRIVALGARALSEIELGDDMRASRDVHDGLDIADSVHYSTSQNVLPVAAAQLRFALGEVRRVRSEKIKFEPLPPDFLIKLEERCTGLLEAQEAYADAVRSVDPHWAAMAGYRVGEMYRSLHRDLLTIPPPEQSKTEKQKQIFFAFMHVRYRVLLEKGLKQLEQTIALGERIGDTSTWIKRAQSAKDEMQKALEEEKAQIAKFPFTEDEIKQALEQLAKKVKATPPAKR